MSKPRPHLFDWRDAKRHWSKRSKPCKHCTSETHLRDFDGKPCHKVCAEKAASTL